MKRERIESPRENREVGIRSYKTSRRSSENGTQESCTATQLVSVYRFLFDFASQTNFSAYGAKSQMRNKRIKHLTRTKLNKSAREKSGRSKMQRAFLLSSPFCVYKNNNKSQVHNTQLSLFQFLNYKKGKLLTDLVTLFVCGRTLFCSSSK